MFRQLEPTDLTVAPIDWRRPERVAVPEARLRLAVRERRPTTTVVLDRLR
jgi:hypothetical protein